MIVYLNFWLELMLLVTSIVGGWAAVTLDMGPPPELGTQ